MIKNITTCLRQNEFLDSIFCATYKIGSTDIYNNLKPGK